MGASAGTLDAMHERTRLILWVLLMGAVLAATSVAFGRGSPIIGTALIGVGWGLIARSALRTYREHRRSHQELRAAADGWRTDSPAAR
jgi:hypothetical protein